MNNGDYSKVNKAINELLKNDIGKKNVTESDIINMINTMDKNEIAQKLNSMGLSFISDKIKNTSNTELIKMLKNNPQLMSKLNNYLK